MEKFKEWSGVVALVILAIVLLTPHTTKLGGATNYDEVDATAIKVGGTNGTRLGPVISTTCNLSQSTAGSHAATTSKEYFCAVSGVSAGDTVIVGLPAAAGASTGGISSIFGGFSVNGLGYATTSGTIGVQIMNNTGAATSSFAQATTSAFVTVLHPVTSVPGL